PGPDEPAGLRDVDDTTTAGLDGLLEVGGAARQDRHVGASGGFDHTSTVSPVVTRFTMDLTRGSSRAHKLETMSVSASEPVTGTATNAPGERARDRRSPKPGTARSAFSHHDFRTIFLGAFATNIGTWMQNVVLGAFAWELTKSQVFVGVMMAAQLGPLLLLSIVGGIIADTFDRRKSLILLGLQQSFFSLMIGIVALPAEPNQWLLVLMVLGVGTGNAMYAPILAAVLPILVPRRDSTGAVALNSVQINASRVSGPIIGAFIYARWAPSWVFFLNALFPA